jgi:tRNA (adenine37-N6)-methyltransferase
MEIQSIGIIHSPHKAAKDCPIQPVYAGGAGGKVEVYPQFADGLEDIDGFSHIWLLYQFDRAGQVILQRPTFLDDQPHGIFASRHPCRPCGIGLSVVRLVGRQDNILAVEGIDVLDETPLLDIKPYLRQFDSIPDATEGWTAGKQWRPKPEGRE